MATVLTEGAIFDSLLEMKDAGLVAASAAATVGGSAKKLDVGDQAVQGDLVVNVTAIEIASNDEQYDIIVQGSTDNFVAAGNQADLATLTVGAKGPKRSDTDTDDAVGKYKIPFRNERNGLVYRYLRVYTVVAGTIATGINYTAFFSKRGYGD